MAVLQSKYDVVIQLRRSCIVLAENKIGDPRKYMFELYQIVGGRSLQKTLGLINYSSARNKSMLTP